MRGKGGLREVLKISVDVTDIFSGGDGETRTPYLGNANAALYQVSYIPKPTTNILYNYGL